MSNHVCPYCQRRFPSLNWGISGNAGGYGIIKKVGLAKANFDRHKKSHRIVKNQKILEVDKNE